ncbi:MAG: hypothetical protein GX074_03925 [Erysipelothrix sp.]|nr:hypothetical protein [Erysipelothrix sp.]
MIVTVLKETYVLVLAEDQKDFRWLDQVGYDPLGEDYYQVIFKDYKDFLDEIEYLEEYGATFEDTDDEDAPAKVLAEVKEALEDNAN